MTNSEKSANHVVLEESVGLSSRRSFLKKAAVGGAVLGAMYVAPQFSSVNAKPAYASITGATAEPTCFEGSGPHYFQGATLEISIPLNTPTTITVYGHEFADVSDLSLQWSDCAGGNTTPATFISSTELTVDLPAVPTDCLNIATVVQNGNIACGGDRFFLRFGNPVL